jgi:hypothetical protein
MDAQTGHSQPIKRKFAAMSGGIVKADHDRRLLLRPRAKLGLCLLFAGAFLSLRFLSVVQDPLIDRRHVRGERGRDAMLVMAVMMVAVPFGMHDDPDDGAVGPGDSLHPRRISH